MRQLREGVPFYGEVAPFPVFSVHPENLESGILAWQRGEADEVLGRDGPLGFARWCLNQPLPFPVKVSSALLVHGNSGCDQEWVPDSTIKVKVGIQRGDVEREQLDRWMERAPDSVKLRLDANRSLDLQTTGEWLEWMRERPQIEFLEQPMREGAERQLMDSYPDEVCRLALDESIVTWDHLDTVLSMGWKGWLVVKPALFGSPEPLFALPESVRRKLVVSSAFETGIGFSFVLEVARRLGDFGIAHGLGTRGAFSTDGLDGWEAALQFEGSVTRDLLGGVWEHAS